MAQVVASLGHGGSVQAERELGWNRGTVRKGLFELNHGPIQDASLTFKGKCPTVSLVTQTYETGVKLTQSAMADLEKQFRRLPGLEKWFVEISPQPA